MCLIWKRRFISARHWKRSAVRVNFSKILAFSSVILASSKDVDGYTKTKEVWKFVRIQDSSVLMRSNLRQHYVNFYWKTKRKSFSTFPPDRISYHLPNFLLPFPSCLNLVTHSLHRSLWHSIGISFKDIFTSRRTTTRWVMWSLLVWLLLNLPSRIWGGFACSERR